MKALHRRCAGLDVHQQEIVACRRIVAGRKVQTEVGRFSTTTQGLLELADWLEDGKVTHVAMEATGVYWKPVWHVLHGRFTLILANAAHIRNVPGRKSDVNDATWIAELLAHGLIRASFVPPQPIQELRDLTRTRKELTREIVRHTQRIHAVLEEANIKLASVITDIVGFSGRRMLKAIVAGETDARRLAELGSSRLAAPREALVAALDGRIRDHHRFLIGQHLKTSNRSKPPLANSTHGSRPRWLPFRDAVERLKGGPGISQTAAQIVIAEIGVDMSQFPSADHVISWAGLCPRLDESAGKRRSTRVRKGATWLKPVLVQSALAKARPSDLASSSRSKPYYLIPSSIAPNSHRPSFCLNTVLAISQTRTTLVGGSTTRGS